MDLILFDDQARERFKPLSWSRPVCALRVGLFDLEFLWAEATSLKTWHFTEAYLSGRYNAPPPERDYLWVNGRVFPDARILQAILSLKDGEVLVPKDPDLRSRIGILALVSAGPKNRWSTDSISDLQKGKKEISFEDEVHFLDQPWDIFRLNDWAIERQFRIFTPLLEKERLREIPKWITLNGPKDRLFIHKDARVQPCMINTETGPVFIGKEAEVMEGCMIRGPLALMDHAVLKMGAKIYGATTIGPHCKVGGEVNNTVFLGMANKAHDGFLGNAVIGEWCNLGADSNNSNLKNNYEEVKIWSYERGGFARTGLQFCGLIMGDHAKCGINTMFNTGTVVGFSANVFGAGFPRNFIPDFSWGGAGGLSTYLLDKAWQTATKVWERRGQEPTETDRLIFETVFEASARFRNW